jgi:hypothetical protein
MSAIHNPQICSICQEPYSPHDLDLASISGKDHPKPCTFHAACLNSWRNIFEEIEAPGPYCYPGHFPNRTICRNDGRHYSHINGQHLIIADQLAVLTTLIEKVASFCNPFLNYCTI